MLVQAPGITIDLPPGWEAEVDQGAGDAGTGAVATPRTHIANFALPPVRGDFGSNAVEAMRRGDILICLLEEDPAAVGSRLHRLAHMPVLVAGDFAADAMQRALPGQSGAQVFFSVGDRAFVLYVVLADRLDRAGQVREINDVLARVRVH